MQVTTLNNKVACTVLGDHRAIQMTGNAFKTVAQKTILIELTVLYGNERLKPGDKVFVKGDCMTLPWTREELSMPGTAGQFILVPEDRIEMVVHKS